MDTKFARRSLAAKQLKLQRHLLGIRLLPSRICTVCRIIYLGPSGSSRTKYLAYRATFVASYSLCIIRGGVFEPCVNITE